MKVDLFKIDGNKGEYEVELPDTVFKISPNYHVIYTAVRAQRNNSRQGTHSSRTRSEVRGGGKKPWRQKGRGSARAGSIRSPIWKGGGRVFGPKPRDYRMKLPDKVNQLARISALATVMQEGRVRVIENFTIESGKTKDMFNILKLHKLESTKVLLLLPQTDQNLLRAGRNIPVLKMRVAEMVSVYDILDCKMILIQEGAITKLQDCLT